VVVSGFGGNGTGWSLNGTLNGTPTPPTVSGDNLTITTAANGWAASAWNNTKVPTGSFTASFTYQVTTGTNPPADGFTFALQNQGPTALGGGGGGLAISGLSPSVALGVNIYPSSGGGAQGISTYVNGNQLQNPYTSVAPVNLTLNNGPSGNPIDFTLTYNASAATLTINLAEETTANTFSETIPGVNIQSLLGSSAAFVGFTGATGSLDAWAADAEGALALLVLLDQLPRNAWRGSGHMFATDGKALAIARAAIADGFDQQVEPALRPFFYLPFMHSESLADQERSLALNQALDANTQRFAVLHRDIVARFGRFPHRNAALGRDTTAEEQRFLDEGGFAG
jgi:uncharacterized protein (DUF924 family)